MSQSSADLRKFILGRFSDDELTSICFDYFPEVYDDFTTGMSKGRKVQRLLDYCRRTEQLSSLMAALERERPVQYQNQFSSISTVEVTPTQPRSRSLRNSRQVFISHAHKDARLAQRLASDLRAYGLPVWIAPDSIQPGEKWVEAINRGLDESEAFILLLTPSAIKSRWVQSETNVAVELEHEGQVQFIPLEIEPADTPPLWRAYQFISFRGGYEAGLKALLSQLDLEVKKPAEMLKPPKEEIASEITSGDMEDRVPDSETVGRDVTTDDDEVLVDRKVYGVPAINNLAQLPSDHEVTTIIWEKDGKEMVRVPEGDSLHGYEKRRLHLVEYWIDKTPVTNAEYARFIEATGRKAPSHWRGGTPSTGIADHPVTMVSWRDAVAYTRWAKKRLPTEEEWEKAARGTDGRLFPWGDQKPNAKLCNFGKKGFNQTMPVGQHSPQADSPYGCVDMSGNVWEWTASVSERGGRVLRGGSWTSNTEDVRVFAHSANSVTMWSPQHGFRTVVSKAEVASTRLSEPMVEEPKRVGARLPRIGHPEQLNEIEGSTIIWEKDGKEMVRVAAGDFLYGDDEERVYLEEYWIDKTPVTNAEYARFVEAAGHEPPKHWQGNSPSTEIANHPVSFVKWHDAVAYAKWAGKRLPTEEEWEKAARGTDGREFPWGNQEPELASKRCNFNKIAGGKTSVGLFSPQGDSPYGCIDMAGNVHEWTNSWWHVKGRHVTRGGSWESPYSENVRCSARSGNLPEWAVGYLGFRLVVG